MKRRVSDVKPICLFAFYGNNTVVVFTSSETTEPFILTHKWRVLPHPSNLSSCVESLDCIEVVVKSKELMRDTSGIYNENLPLHRAFHLDFTKRYG